MHSKVTNIVREEEYTKRHSGQTRQAVVFSCFARVYLPATRDGEGYCFILLNLTFVSVHEWNQCGMQYPPSRVDFIELLSQISVLNNSM